MNRLFSLLLSVADELIPYFRPSNRKGFIYFIFIITANSIPALGVIAFKWNPFVILLIYWGESLIIGIFNVLKMLISGLIQNNKFAPSEFSQAVGLSVFFTFHYGIFMLVHGIFIIAFMFLSSITDKTGAGGTGNPFYIINTFLPEHWTAIEFLESEFSAIAALFVSNLISFFLFFIKTGEYNYTKADTYMMRPYKRIIIMHMTIIFGAFALFITGFKSAVFIIVWIGIKMISDMKMHVSEIKKYGFNFPVTASAEKNAV